MNLNLAVGSGSVEVSDVAFGREFNEALVHQVVVAHMAGARQGTSARWWPQTMASKGYRSRSCGYHPFTNLAFWWCHVCRETTGSFGEGES